MSAERFMKLVEENRGFELVLGYRDWEDRYMGGKGNTYWYAVTKNGKQKELYKATLQDGKWQDCRITGKGSKRKEASAPAGSTIRRIAENAFVAQDEPWVKDRKGKLIEDNHPHLHFVKGFGDKAADVSAAYGVTIAYNDIKDVSVGFHLRDLVTGAEVELPE